MTKKLSSVSRALDRFVEAIGRTVSLLVLVIIAIVSLEMVLRFVFNRPTPWAHELSAWFQVALVFLGGGYAFNKGQFVRIDVVHMRMSPRAKAIVDLTLGSVLLGLFAGAMIWHGTDLAWQSFRMGEVSATGGWSGPVFIAKGLVPLGGILLVMAWISHMLKQLVILFEPE
jgi:TRAP-type mannitol/chloroaromatic compound transport system permease small subunit